MKKIIFIIIFATLLLLARTDRAISATQIPGIDPGEYSISMTLSDSATGGEVTRTTKLVQRIYTITNNSNLQLNIARFKATSFYFARLQYGTNATGYNNWNYNYDNIVIPPHSSQAFAIYDRSDLDPRYNLNPGYYMGRSYGVIFFDLNVLNKNIPVTIDCVVLVK